MANHDKIINDLLRARPLGPNHPKKKLTYKKVVSGEKWCKKEYDYVSVYKLEPSEALWGYTDEDLFRLGLRSHHDVTTYLLHRDFPGVSSSHELGRKKATLTRRANRLWSRIKSSVTVVGRKGGAGIYKVDGGWSWTIGYLFADNHEEAETAAKLYFGYLVDPTYSYSYPKVSFVDFGLVEDIIPLNNALRDEVRSQMESKKLRVKEIQEDIEAHKSRLEALGIVESQQINVES